MKPSFFEFTAHKFVEAICIFLFSWSLMFFSLKSLKN
jgi:hypothetical protein